MTFLLRNILSWHNYVWQVIGNVKQLMHLKRWYSLTIYFPLNPIINFYFYLEYALSVNLQQLVVIFSHIQCNIGWNPIFCIISHYWIHISRTFIQCHTTTFNACMNRMQFCWKHVTNVHIPNKVWPTTNIE